MTEVSIDGKKMTIHDQTRTEFLTIRSLLQRGFTYRQINEKFRAEGKTCSNYKIKKAQLWTPNGLLKQTETQTETSETSHLNKPPRPPIRPKTETQTETRVKQRDTSEEMMWREFDARKREASIKVKEHIPESVFMACAFYLQTRSGRAGEAKNQLTAAEATNVRSIENWERYQEWKANVLAGNTPKDKQNRKDLMGELKEKLKQRNGGA